MVSKKIQLLEVTLFIILGLLISLQIKSIQKEEYLNNKQKDLGKLQQLLKEEQDRSLALQEQLKTYENKAESYEENLLKGSQVETLRLQLEKYRFLAGLTDVQGPGIIITLDDSKKRVYEGVNPNDTIIHDGDLIEIINLLRSNSAQAISINGERIISTSEIQCAGPTISVNHVRYAVPYVIKAIGDADYLEASLKAPGSYLDIMSIYGIQISIKKDYNIVIPKYRGLLSRESKITEIGG